MNRKGLVLIAVAYLFTLGIYAAFDEPETEHRDSVEIIKQPSQQIAQEQVAQEPMAQQQSSAEPQPVAIADSASTAAASTQPGEGAKTSPVPDTNAAAPGAYQPAADTDVAAQRAVLAVNTEGKGFGPQSPRDIDSLTGANRLAFAAAPAYTQMNLCNIHFHKNAEHKGGEFTTYAGNGNGQGYQSGYAYDGELTTAELAAADANVCAGKQDALQSGDTIEVHYVHTTAQVEPGPTLGACLSESVKNPQLRVETQVYVLVNDENALDFNELAAHGVKNGLQQALNIPTTTGAPVQYAGSTTGPDYNEKGSPFQVTWSVRPKVAKVSIQSVGQWCEGNVFDEDHAHAVRNLVINPKLLSPIM